MEPFGLAGVFGSPTQNMDLRLPGQWAPAETGGLYQNGFRDYDPTLGRYIELASGPTAGRQLGRACSRGGQSPDQRLAHPAGLRPAVPPSVKPRGGGKLGDVASDENRPTACRTWTRPPGRSRDHPPTGREGSL